jgi:hypothetical protein
MTFEANLLGGAIEVSIDSAWNDLGKIQVSGHGMAMLSMFDDWLIHSAIGKYGHGIGSATMVRPSDLHHALQRDAKIWFPRFTRLEIDPTPELPTDVVS